jgi:hypothetical protein
MAVFAGGRFLNNLENLVFNFDPSTKPTDQGATLTLFSLIENPAVHPTTEAQFDALLSTPSRTTVRGHNNHIGSISWANIAGSLTRFGSYVGWNVPPYITMYGFPNIHDDTKGDHNFGWFANGQIFCPVAGTYNFYLDGDDAFDMHVADAKVTQWYDGHGFNGTTLPINPGITDFTISIPSPGWYNFRARFTEIGGGFGIAMGWKKPGDANQSPVPAENLRPFNAQNRITPTHFIHYGSGPKTNNTIFQGNGLNSAIAYLNDTRLDSQNITVETWIRPTTTAQNGFIFEKGTLNSQYALHIEGSNITWRQQYSGTGSSDLTTPSSVLSTTNYNHLVATYTSGARRIYLNGVQIASDNRSGTLLVSNGGSSIGTYGGFSGSRGNFYTGEIAQVRVYNVALTQAQVQSNFNLARNRFAV